MCTGTVVLVVIERKEEMHRGIAKREDIRRYLEGEKEGNRECDRKNIHNERGEDRVLRWRNAAVGCGTLVESSATRARG